MTTRKSVSIDISYGLLPTSGLIDLPRRRLSQGYPLAPEKKDAVSGNSTMHELMLNFAWADPIPTRRSSAPSLNPCPIRIALITGKKKGSYEEH